MQEASSLVRDLAPDSQAFLKHVIEGLSAEQKWLSPMYLYDRRGSELFDRICELPEYYPTRTELSIMEAHVPEMARAIGRDALVIEPGSGSGLKTHRLLSALEAPVAYVPVEISRQHLLESASRLRKQFPAVEILPLCADFTRAFDIPRPTQRAQRRIVYFPGSTIGNFGPQEARTLLGHLAETVGAEGGMLIGVDLRKDRESLERAYDDSQGITAQFNLNLLQRMNRELQADFDLEAFSHRATWNETDSRIEMHLVSKREQSVTIDAHVFHFASGEYILSECSYKFTLAGFAHLARQAGWQVTQVWTDPDERFSVQFLEHPAS